MGADAAGRQILKSFYGPTERIAEQKAQQWLRDHPNGPPTPAENAPLNDLINIWLEAEIAPPVGKQGTLEDYSSKIRCHIADGIGRRPAGTIVLHDINMWVRGIVKQGKGRTAEKCLEIVNSAYNYAVANGILAHNPAALAKAPPYERHEAQPLTLVQFRAFVEAAGGRLDMRKPYRTKDRKVKHYPPIDPRLEVLYLVLCYVGLRRGEILALRWSDIRDGYLFIERQIDDEGREWGYVKTDKSKRAVELSDEVIDALAAHQVRMQAEAHDQGRRFDGLIFPSSEGTALRPRNLHRHFKLVLASAGLPASIRIHDLRHTAGSVAAAAGVATAAISALLGHASTDITQRLYIHGDRDGSKAAMERIARRLRGEE